MPRGAQLMYYHEIPSPVGPLRLVATDVGLRQLCLPPEVRKRSPACGWVQKRDHPVLLQAATVLGEYFSGEKVQFQSVPCDPQGSDFRKRVWQAMRSLKYAETTTYGDIAASVGQPKGARAVGGAVGANPIPIVIPCHRVLGQHRALTGYTGGLNIKRALLKLEGITYRDRHATDHKSPPPQEDPDTPTARPVEH